MTIGELHGLMGHQHSSKPVTAEDREMSKRHKAHRREVDSMPNGKRKLQLSIMYNESHAKEHLDALKNRKKQIQKMEKTG